MILAHPIQLHPNVRNCHQLGYQHLKHLIVYLDLHMIVIQDYFIDTMTSLRKSQLPFADTIASFSKNML